MKALLHPKPPTRRSRFTDLALVLPVSLLTACEAGQTPTSLEHPKLVVTAEAPFVEVALSIDTNGEVELTPRLSPEKRIPLGPVSITFGIEETMKLMGAEPYRLFILWEREDGTVWRDEYSIGQRFVVKLDRAQWVRQIEGDSGCITIVVETVRPAIVPDSPFQVTAVDAAAAVDAAEAEETAMQAPNIQIQPAEPAEALANQFTKEPIARSKPPEESLSRQGRTPALREDRERLRAPTSRRAWDRPSARPWRGEREGVTLRVNVTGSFNDIYVEEVDDPYRADDGEHPVHGDGGQRVFRLLEGTGAVITFTGYGNRLHRPSYLRSRVRLQDESR